MTGTAQITKREWYKSQDYAAWGWFSFRVFRVTFSPCDSFLFMRGHLYILTKDGKPHSSQPEGREDCRIWYSNSLHGDIYIMYYKDKERAEPGDECFVSKEDRGTNKLEKPIRFYGICNTFLMIDE